MGLEKMESALLCRDGRYIVDAIPEIESCFRLIAKAVCGYTWVSHLFVTEVGSLGCYFDVYALILIRRRVGV